MRIILFIFTFVLSLTSAAQTKYEYVRVKTNVECYVSGTSTGKQFYDEKIKLTVFQSEDSFWGMGIKRYNYSVATETSVFLMNPQDLSIKHPSNYAIKFGTGFKAHTGAFWGQESSIVYFDSFDSFSPIQDSGIIKISKDKNDYCNFDALILPVADH